MNGEALVREHDNVVLTRSFSKIWSRWGACWLGLWAAIIDTITRIGLTFPLATLIACGNRRIRGSNIAITSEVRRLLRDEATQKLSEAGIHVYPGHGNFILMEMASPKSLAREMDTALRAEGISLRRFASPAFDRCLRMTLGRHSETRTATDAIIRLYHEKRKARA